MKVRICVIFVDEVCGRHASRPNGLLCLQIQRLPLFFTQASKVHKASTRYALSGVTRPGPASVWPPAPDMGGLIVEEGRIGSSGFRQLSSCTAARTEFPFIPFPSLPFVPSWHALAHGFLSVTLQLQNFHVMAGCAPGLEEQVSGRLGRPLSETPEFSRRLFHNSPNGSPPKMFFRFTK